MRWLFVLFLFSVVGTSSAQTPVASDDEKTLMVRLENVNVVSSRIWDNDTVRYRYNQMRYYVTTILPYLNEAVQLFSEIDAKLHDPNLDRQSRKAFIKEKETLVRTRFEDQIRDLNTTQGVLLMKLIARQTGLNLYEMLSEFKSPIAAMKWQTWAKINGFNLNRKYHPHDEPDLEHIMDGLGYPLPVFYAKNDQPLN
jgi:hypothetical protein